jgi:O-antigen/teichoic acid export membrane protein
MSHSSLVVLTIPATLAWVVGLAWKLGALRGVFRFRYVIVWSTWRALVKVAIPLAIGTGLTTIYYNLDSVMLSKLDTYTAVGLYGIAYKFAGVIQFFSWALGMALLGPLVTAWPDDPSAFWATVRRAAGLLALGAVIISVEFSIFAGPAIQLLYGSRFVSGAGAARFVVVSECVGFFTYLAATTLIAMGKNRLYPLGGLLGVVVNFSLNIYVIPHYSYNGAAWATLITEVIVAAILWMLLRAQGKVEFPTMLTAKAVVGGFLAAGVAVLLDLAVPWPIAAVLSFGVYVLFLHVAKVTGPAGLPSLVRDEGRES